MLDPVAYLTYIISSFPTAEAQNSTGAATPDGTEFIAQLINDLFMGPMQATLDYAGLTPNGVTEAAGASQFLEAIGKGFAVGPGIRVPWDKFDDPSVTGDRVLLFSNAKQGKLRASYADLDAAVYVGDGNNPTAPYYYHADDAPGVTRNTTGAYLILPPGPADSFMKQYSEAEGDFTVTGTGWTTIRAVAIPYKTSDGALRLRVNITGTVTPAGGHTLAISGVTFKNIASYSQAVVGWLGGADLINFIEAVPNTGNISTNYDSSSSGDLSMSADLELNSWPTWTDDFSFPWGVTY